MTEYLHHVPGRLRIRSKLFRANTPERSSTLRQIRALEGVSGTRLNHKSGSLVVSYDTDTTGPEQIIDTLEACYKSFNLIPVTPVKKSADNSNNLQPPWNNITKEVSKVAFNMLISRGVSYSISSILGNRI